MWFEPAAARYFASFVYPFFGSLAEKRKENGTNIGCQRTDAASMVVVMA
jgi:hypothetical protein